MAHGTVAFILCSTRSGSTWLALMLGSNSRAQYAGELNHMYRAGPEACSLCSERSRVCPLFHDVASFRPREIHAALLERTSKDVLADNSKSISWARKTLDAAPEKQYIHLLRDPRAVVNAWRSRGRGKGLERWIDENYEVRRFLEERGLSYRVVTYNELADHTDEALRGLCDWLGLAYEPAQKSYWEFEHHGAGRNGATASFLRDYVASDDAFYAERRKTNFHDRRWQTELAESDQRAIAEDARLQRLLRDFGYALSQEGLLPTNVESGLRT
jgi:hypothetical protein